MQEVHRLALEDIENNFDYDTRIVEVNFQDASFLRELRRRGYNNIAGTGDVENFTPDSTSLYRQIIAVYSGTNFKRFVIKR